MLVIFCIYLVKFEIVTSHEVRINIIFLDGGSTMKLDYHHTEKSISKPLHFHTRSMH